MSRNLNDRNASFVGVLQRWAERQPENVAFRFLKTGDCDGITATITYGLLARRSRAIAAHLQDRGLVNSRVLLLYPAGLEFIAGFFGALTAHVIAVPVPVPTSRDFDRSLPRLLRVAKNAAVAAVLTTRSVLDGLAETRTEIPELAGTTWIVTEEIDDAPSPWHMPEPAPESVAFLQYTSGSIATPTGVMVTHKNLLTNQLALAEAMDIRHDRVADRDGHMFVSWLPAFHDMGLIFPILHTVFQGSRSILMSPEHFLGDPLRWPRALSVYRGDIGGCPNFGYELCAQLAAPEKIASLDLSAWRVAFTGGEPVRATTLRNFAERFAGTGFRRAALQPAYGLTESTLLVTASAPARQATVLALGPATIRDVVGVGRPPTGHSVLIVDPATGKECPEDALGEVWVTGDSVAAGYFGDPERTREVFGAETDDGRGGFLRTGDLGFIHDGELFIGGRLKDLIIVAGRNLFPQDLETTAENAHPAIRRGCVAAFAVERESGEEVVIVAEIHSEAFTNRDAIAGAVRSAVSASHDAPVGAVVLIRPGSIFKTASGKIQRSACHNAYLAGRLPAVGEPDRRKWGSTAGKTTVVTVERIPGVRGFGSDDPHIEVAEVENWFTRTIAGRAGLDNTGIDPNRPLVEFGLGSLGMVKILGELSESLHHRLDVVLVFDHPTIAELSSAIVEELHAAAATTERQASDE